MPIATSLPTQRVIARSLRSPLWLWPNILSLDAPFVAVLWQILLARSVRVHLGDAEPVLLALAVWLLYIADHILDALRPQTDEWEAPRKSFFRHHLRLMSFIGICVAGVSMPLAFFLLRRPLFHYGLALSAAVICYFALIHLAPPAWRARWPREAAVACLFTLGTFLAVWSASGRETNLLYAPAILFSLLCWVNVCAIETWEWKRSFRVATGRPSPSTQWAANYLAVLAIAIALLAALFAFTSLSSVVFSAAALASGIAFALLAIYRRRLTINVQRVAADLALCTPLLFLPFVWVR